MNDRLGNPNRFTAMANGAREQFTKLLILDFLASSLYLSVTLDRQLVRRGRSYGMKGIPISWTERDIFLGRSDVRKFVQDGYYNHLCLCEKALQELQELADAINFIARALPARLALNGGTNIARQNVDNASDCLGEQVSLLQQQCHQHRSNVERAIARLNSLVEARNKTLNIHESQSIKRLTVLATIFLPLSLSASILSMQFRLKDLQLKLYDFLGVFTMIGTAALLLLLLVRAMPSINKTFLFRGFSVSLRELACLRLAPSLYKPSRYWSANWLIIVLAMLFVLWFALVWAVVLVSFMIGMVMDVILGLKILGFGLASLSGCALIGYGFWTLFNDQLRGLLHRGAESSET